MICNRCGKELAPDATECDRCYEKVERIDVEMYRKRLKSKSNVWELLLTLILVVALIFIGIVLYNNLKDTKPKEEITNKRTNTPIDSINDAKDIVNEYNNKQVIK